MYSKTRMKQRILLSGKDGIDLLQRITTLDFKRLLPGTSQRGLILNPQGKILCYFEVELRTTSDQIEVAFDDSFMELLDQYTFGERYKVEKLESPAPISTPDSEKNRILARTPKLGNEFVNNGETNPLEINLDSAIHDQKGCYPGQEVIEKIVAIGSPAKRLCVVKYLGESPPEIHLPLELDVGRLTSFEFPYGLAIVRKTHASAGTALRAGEQSFQVQ